ncbi:MAG: hypothetical protein K0Q80_1639 [Microvirga sp.]|nr:hypothetical protein [Microvirga sp.]
MGAFPVIGERQGLEIRPVIGGFQFFRQLGIKAKAAVIIGLPKNDDEIVPVLRQAHQAMPDKSRPDALPLEGRRDGQRGQHAGSDGPCLVQ